MDFNTLFIWIVVISCGGMFARLLKTGEWRRNGWTIMCAIVLVVTGILYVFRPQIAGLVGGGLWMAFFLAPSLLNRAMLSASMRQKFSLAAWISRIARLLHPMDGWWQQPKLLHALSLAERGETDAATEMLARLAVQQPGIRRLANLQAFRVSRRWNDLIAWAQLDLGEHGLRNEPTLAAMYIRALGEVGAVNEMIEMLARSMHAMHSPAHAYTRAMARLFAFAFAGDVTEVEALTSDALAQLPADVKQFWIATALLAAGSKSAGEERLLKLVQSASPAIRAAAEERLARSIVPADEVLTPQSRRLLHAIARERQQEDRFLGRIGPRRLRRAATITLILINLAIFAVEIFRGGSENDAVLEAMGAVHPRIFDMPGEWWRVVAANFLHFGFAHIAFNMLALWVLGPFVEAALGKVRYLVVYMFSGIVALASAVVLQRLGVIREDFLVGASGCIMGLVGATIAILLRARVIERARIASQRLNAVMLIVIVQLVFDAMTPQVSSTAHIAGLIAGFAATVFLRHRTTPSRMAPEVVPISPPQAVATKI